uniref:Cadherin domain-containing protein n=1 Tax=Steinernema glaseri TaxID=37863 RepID=A0A1I7YBF8_9BILA
MKIHHPEDGPDPTRLHTFTYVADRGGVQQVVEYDLTIPL